MTLRGFIASGHLFAKAVRFAGIGVLSSAIYAVVTAFLVSVLDVAPVIASMLGYCAALPSSFVGHREVSFRSRGRPTIEAGRFFFLQLMNFAVATGSMYLATSGFGIPYGWGIFAAVMLVPVASFVFMNLWVFQQQGRPGRGGIDTARPDADLSKLEHVET